MNKRHILVFCISILLVFISGCGTSPPEDVTKKFFEELTSGDAGNALKYICPEGIAAVVAIDVDWDDEHYEILSNDGVDAQVHVSGVVRITAKNLERFGTQMGVDLPHTEVGLQVGVNFDGVELKYDFDREKWCIDKHSISSFLKYLLELFTEELSNL